MGVRTLSKVWEWSRAEGTNLLVMLALADHCGDDDVCYPGVARIARKCRVSDRTVQRAVTELAANKELERIPGAGLVVNGARGTGVTNAYRLLFQKGCQNDGAIPERGDIQGVNGVTNRDESGDTAKSPKPSVEPSGKPSGNGAHAPGVVDIKARKRKTKKIGRITDPLGLRLGSIFGRSPDTAWSDKEIVALEDVHSLAITEVRIRAVECYYASERRKEKNCCRRDLVTLLNNLNTEADRAILWCQQNRQSCDNMKRRLWPNEYKSTSKAKKLPPAQPAASDEERARFLKASRAWRAAGMPTDRPIEAFLEG